jgi:hypothetical protein
MAENEAAKDMGIHLLESSACEQDVQLQNCYLKPWWFQYAKAKGVFAKAVRTCPGQTRTKEPKDREQ